MTHEPRYAAWADRVVFMRDGRIVDEASVSPSTAAVVGARRGDAVNRCRLPLRLARREVCRRPGRTALVALLVAIPVAGMAIAVTLIRTEAETPAEDWQQEYGQADAVAASSSASRWHAARRRSDGRVQWTLPAG